MEMKNAKIEIFYSFIHYSNFDVGKTKNLKEIWSHHSKYGQHS